MKKNILSIEDLDSILSKCLILRNLLTEMEIKEQELLIKDIVNGSIERRELIEDTVKKYLNEDIDLRRSESLKIGEELVGNKVRVRVVKNKVAPPFKKSEIEILYNEGISKEGELLDIGVSRNIVEKNGSFYSFKGERLGQGRESVRKFLKNNQEISNEIEGLIMNPSIEIEDESLDILEA